MCRPCTSAKGVACPGSRRRTPEQGEMRGGCARAGRDEGQVRRRSSKSMRRCSSSRTPLPHPRGREGRSRSVGASSPSVRRQAARQDPPSSSARQDQPEHESRRPELQVRKRAARTTGVAGEGAMGKRGHQGERAERRRRKGGAPPTWRASASAPPPARSGVGRERGCGGNGRRPGRGVKKERLTSRSPSSTSPRRSSESDGAASLELLRHCSSAAERRSHRSRRKRCVALCWPARCR
jgi:hypothetical protein